MPPPPLPVTLPEYLDRYLTALRIGGRRWAKAERFTAQLVTAAAAGTQPPEPDGLDGEEMYVVGEMLDELFARTRDWPPSHPLILQAKRDWDQRTETLPPQAQQPGQLFRPRPRARLKPRPGPLFRPPRDRMTLLPAVVARQLYDLAATGEASARFLRELASAVSDGSAVPGQDTGADTTSLNEAGREAVGALLQVAARRLQAQGKSAHSADLSQIVKAWQAYAAEGAAR